MLYIAVSLAPSWDSSCSVNTGWVELTSVSWRNCFVLPFRVPLSHLQYQEVTMARFFVLWIHWPLHCSHSPFRSGASLGVQGLCSWRGQSGAQQTGARSPSSQVWSQVSWRAAVCSQAGMTPQPLFFGPCAPSSYSSLSRGLLLDVSPSLVLPVFFATSVLPAWKKMTFYIWCGKACST